MASIASKITLSISFFSFFLLLLAFLGPTLIHSGDIITIRSPNLFPESFKWDPSVQHFVLTSYHHGSVYSVSANGTIKTLISDPDLPSNVVTVGIAVDSRLNRLLVLINSINPSSTFAALAAYDRRSHSRIFLSQLSDDTSDRPIANDVTVDSAGNAYVTNSAGNFVWKIDATGFPTVFSRSSIFSSQHVYEGQPGSFCGLNGIAYVSNGGYLLAVQSNTGKMYKIDGADGTASLVQLSKDLIEADGMVMRSDDEAVVVASYRAWFVKSEDGWAHARITDEIDLDVEKFPTAVAKREDKIYVLYGHILEGMMGNVDREEFSIEEIVVERNGALMYVGLGTVCFLVWRAYLLVKNMKKKKKRS